MCVCVREGGRGLACPTRPAIWCTQLAADPPPPHPPPHTTTHPPPHTPTCSGEDAALVDGGSRSGFTDVGTLWRFADEAR